MTVVERVKVIVPGHVRKVELTRLANGLDTGYERKKEMRSR